MNPQPPAAPSPAPAAAPEVVTEAQAFTRAWMVFVVLVAVVLGVLWAVKAHFG
ncbi:hypothetical protein QF040_000572 [Variovorax sp. W2I14]|jgi:hypothetical protein